MSDWIMLGYFFAGGILALAGILLGHYIGKNL